MATALAAIDKNVLIIDLDPQGNASTGLGIDRNKREISTYDLLVGKNGLAETLVQTAVPRLFVSPSTLDLLGVEMEISQLPDRAFRLKNVINEYNSDDTKFDFILIESDIQLVVHVIFKQVDKYVDDRLFHLYL